MESEKYVYKQGVSKRFLRPKSEDLTQFIFVQKLIVNSQAVKVIFQQLFKYLL